MPSPNRSSTSTQRTKNGQSSAVQPKAVALSVVGSAVQETIFVRSLTVEEIVSQPVHLFHDMNIDANNVDRLQIMFMSMGEPMLNMKALEPAIRQLHTMYARAALLVSTSGPNVPSTYVDFRKLSHDAESAPYSVMKIVYLDGQTMNRTTLEEVRRRAAI